MVYPADTHIHTFRVHRNALTLLLDKLPEDQADFHAWDEGLSF